MKVYACDNCGEKIGILLDVDSIQTIPLKQTKSPLEKTAFDSGCITHDGIQFNRHFIELSRRVDQLEAKIKSHTQKYI